MLRPQSRQPGVQQGERKGLRRFAPTTLRGKIGATAFAGLLAIAGGKFGLDAIKRVASGTVAPKKPVVSHFESRTSTNNQTATANFKRENNSKSSATNRPSVGTGPKPLGEKVKFSMTGLYRMDRVVKAYKLNMRKLSSSQVSVLNKASDVARKIQQPPEVVFRVIEENYKPLSKKIPVEYEVGRFKAAMAGALGRSTQGHRLDCITFGMELSEKDTVALLGMLRTKGSLTKLKQ